MAIATGSLTAPLDWISAAGRRPVRSSPVAVADGAALHVRRTAGTSVSREETRPPCTFSHRDAPSPQQQALPHDLLQRLRHR